MSDNTFGTFRGLSGTLGQPRYIGPLRRTLGPSSQPGGVDPNSCVLTESIEASKFSQEIARGLHGPIPPNRVMTFVLSDGYYWQFHISIYGGISLYRCNRAPIAPPSASRQRLPFINHPVGGGGSAGTTLRGPPAFRPRGAVVPSGGGIHNSVPYQGAQGLHDRFSTTGFGAPGRAYGLGGPAEDAAAALNNYLGTSGCDCSSTLIALSKAFGRAYGGALATTDGAFGPRTYAALTEVLARTGGVPNGPPSGCFVGNVSNCHAVPPPAQPVPVPVLPTPVQDTVMCADGVARPAGQCPPLPVTPGTTTTSTTTTTTAATGMSPLVYVAIGGAVLAAIGVAYVATRPPKTAQEIMQEESRKNPHRQRTPGMPRSMKRHWP